MAYLNLLLKVQEFKNESIKQPKIHSKYPDFLFSQKGQVIKFFENVSNNVEKTIKTFKT